MGRMSSAPGLSTMPETKRQRIGGATDLQQRSGCRRALTRVLRSVYRGWSYDGSYSAVAARSGNLPSGVFDGWIAPLLRPTAGQFSWLASYLTPMGNQSKEQRSRRWSSGPAAA